MIQYIIGNGVRPEQGGRYDITKNQCAGRGCSMGIYNGIAGG